MNKSNSPFVCSETFFKMINESKNNFDSNQVRYSNDPKSWANYLETLFCAKNCGYKVNFYFEMKNEERFKLILKVSSDPHLIFDQICSHVEEIESVLLWSAYCSHVRDVTRKNSQLDQGDFWKMNFSEKTNLFASGVLDSYLFSRNLFDLVSINRKIYLSLVEKSKQEHEERWNRLVKVNYLLGERTDREDYYGD